MYEDFTRGETPMRVWLMVQTVLLLPLDRETPWAGWEAAAASTVYRYCILPCDPVLQSIAHVRGCSRE